jgi:hypothetical protein
MQNSFTEAVMPDVFVYKHIFLNQSENSSQL